MAVIQDVKKSAPAQSKISEERVRVGLFLGSLTLAVSVADHIIAGYASEKEAAPDSSIAGSRSFFIETCTVLVCMLLPAFLMHCLKQGGGKVVKESRPAKHLKKEVSSPSQSRTSSRSSSPDRVLKDSGNFEAATGEVSPKIRTSSTASNPSGAKNLAQAVSNAVRLGEQERAERIMRDIIKLKTDDPMPFNAVIHGCAKKGNMARAKYWLQEMRDAGIAPNTISYNILMDASVKSDNAEAAEWWLAKMLQDGVQANEVSYATVIHARAKRGETDLAENWLQRMLEAGIEPNIVSYNSLIYACGRKGDVDGAEKWLKEAESRGLEARVTTFTAVVDACAKCCDVERAEKWMNRMAEANVEPNVVSFSAMIDSCAKVGDPSKALYWHERMKAHGVQPNAHSFSAIISSFAKSGNVAAACEQFAEMEKCGVPADVVTYSGVLDACAKAGDMDRAKEVFARMKANGVKPNLVSYASLARPFAHSGDWQEVERIEEEMTKSGMKMNEYFLYTLLLAYASGKPRQADRAEAAFRKAISQGLEANKHVMMALGRALGRAKSAQLARNLGISTPA
eukprot:TRINITY_DN49337_c0_g1_i1.p1 TRINITY_DN49337_c0_g1~~TRINITY_DN49337_c0_g1_i1.p1  ORF type:complete len:568 (+),score=132.56 TRINITY_DN49337_c0_g1_i1:186-1889(+)